MNKIEEFFFDIFGLFLPGLLFVMMMYLVLICNTDINSSKNILKDSYEYVIKFNGLKIPDYVTALLTLFLFYLVGHIIKVLSKFLYDIFSIIVDNFLLKPVRILEKVVASVDEKGVLLQLLDKAIAIFLEVFSFKSDKYSSQFQGMVKACRDALHSEHKMAFFKENEEWYPFYKSAIAIAEESKVKTHARFFLAKYNFYRSIAFIFVIHILLITLCGNAPLTINNKYYGWIILIDFVGWATFHIKFKRYWKQCGNEAILGLYHSLFKLKTDLILGEE